MSDEAARLAVLRVLPGLAAEPEALGALLDALVWRSLQRHEVLCRQGEPADGMYLLAAGRLQISQTELGIRRWVFPGESVGTWALFSDDGARSADVLAAHASRVAHLDRARFDALTRDHPALLREVVASLVRYEQSKEVSPAPRTTVLVLVPLDAGGPIQVVAEALRAALDRLGPTVAFAPAADGDDLTAIDAALDRVTEQPGHVLLVAPTPHGPCTDRLLHRADHVLLLAEADRSPAPRPHEPRRGAEDRRTGQRVSLLLLHPADRRQPRHTAAWLAGRDVDDHHHLRLGRAADMHRAARLLTHRGVGLVLSGGSSLGGAHIGVIAALLERRVPIDMLGGTSAGAGIAAVLALHGAYEPVHDAIVEAFFVRNPIGKLAFPLVALTAGGPLDETAKELCGDVQIEDLWIPWFGVSASLTTGKRVLHRRGPLWQAVRTTTSIPGLMPPVTFGEQILVDGGLLDNFPVGTMKSLCGGPVLGSNVFGTWEGRPTTRGRLRRLLDRVVGSSDLPDLVSTLRRVATLGDQARAGDQHANCDLAFLPDMSEFSAGRLDRFGARARRGYEHAVDVLAGTDLAALLPGWRTGDAPALAPPDAARGAVSARFGVVGSGR